MSGDLITGSYDDQQLVSLLRRGAISSMFPRLHENNSPQFDNEDEYIFSKFVSHLNDNNAQVLDYISNLRRAAIYSDLILHLREPRKPSSNSQYVYAYLDSPLIMDVLGLGGKLRQAFAERLVASLGDMMVIPLASPVMVEEIRGNIKALMSRDPRDRFGPTADALRRGEFRIDYVEACLDRIESLIDGAKIKIDKQFHTYLTPKLDTAGKDLEGELLSKLQSHYRIFGAAERDAESLIVCLGRRGDFRPRDMYTAKCFFVTSNDMLAAIGNRFFRTNFNYRDSTFPIIVTRSTIAAMTDAISGIASRDSMSEREMIISAADATSYNPRVFDNIEAILKELNPQHAKDLANILQRTDISELAMDLVRGNPGNVTRQRVSEITDSVKNRLEVEAENKIAERVDREREEAGRKMEELSSEISRHQEDVLHLKNIAQNFHNSALQSIVERNRISRALVRKSNLIGYIIACVVGLFVGGATYLLTINAEGMNVVLKNLLAIATALASGLPLAGLPSVKRYIAATVENFEANRLHDHAKGLGYKTPKSSLLNKESLESLLDKQFSERIEQDKQAKISDLFGNLK